MPKESKLLTLRLAPELSSIEPVLEYLHLPTEQVNFNDIYDNLYHLRNIGLSTPREACKWISGLKNSWWYDGATAQTLTSIEREFELIIKAEQVT